MQAYAGILRHNRDISEARPSLPIGCTSHSWPMGRSREEAMQGDLTRPGQRPGCGCLGSETEQGRHGSAQPHREGILENVIPGSAGICRPHWKAYLEGVQDRSSLLSNNWEMWNKLGLMLVPALNRDKTPLAGLSLSGPGRQPATTTAVGVVLCSVYRLF